MLSAKEFDELLKKQLIVGLNISPEEWQNLLSQKNGSLPGEYWILIDERKIPWGSGCAIQRTVQKWQNVGNQFSLSDDKYLGTETIVTPVDC